VRALVVLATVETLIVAVVYLRSEPPLARWVVITGLCLFILHLFTLYRVRLPRERSLLARVGLCLLGALSSVSISFPAGMYLYVLLAVSHPDHSMTLGQGLATVNSGIALASLGFLLFGIGLLVGLLRRQNERA